MGKNWHKGAKVYLLHTTILTPGSGGAHQLNHGMIKKKPGLKKQVVKKDNHKTQIFIIDSHHCSSSPPSSTSS
jgi:hypothetical protein